MLIGISLLYRTYILVFQIICIIGYRTAYGTETFRNLQIKFLSIYRLIRVCARVIIYKRNGWYYIFARITWHSHKIIYHVTFHTISRKFRLIRNLSVISIKVFREIYFRLFNKFQVTIATYNHTYIYRFARFYIFLVYLCTYVKLSNATGKARRARRQRIYLHRKSGCPYRTFNFGISGTAVKEGFIRIYIPVLLYHCTLKDYGRYLQFSCHLRIHNILAPCDTAVWTPVNTLHRI